MPERGKACGPAIRLTSTFGATRHRTWRLKGCLSRDGMLHMMFKLSQCAEKKWRKLRGFNFHDNVKYLSHSFPCALSFRLNGHTVRVGRD